MINPYANINWSAVQRVMSCSHEHCETQTQFGTLLSGDVRHIAISNYYPSKPVYPLSDMFSNVPENAISCPNAEHHHMNIDKLHLNGLGSFYESGKPRDETPVGCGGANWAVIIPQILRGLQFADAGGVTINHPVWTGLSQKQVQNILDFDDRVLGLEFFNHTSELDNQTGWALNLWDAILKTGRRCWGFAVADHEGQLRSDWLGRNMLLVDTATEYNCLKAYRDGAFYGQLGKTDLAFTDITYQNGAIHIAADNATSIKIIIDGEATEYQGAEATVSVPSGSVYVRVEAHSATDAVYSNPIMINPKKYKKENMTEKILMYMS